MPFFSRYGYIFCKSSNHNDPFFLYSCSKFFILFDWQVNQIGSVTESIEAVKMSKQAGWGVMASHRRYDILGDSMYCGQNLIKPRRYWKFSFSMQWRNRRHFHCWSISWIVHGNPCFKHCTAVSTSTVIYTCWNLLSRFVCQGQIKTGAPCRSERLAKYNQASITLFLTSNFLLAFSGFLIRSNKQIVILGAAAEDWGGAWFRSSVRRSQLPHSCCSLLDTYGSMEWKIDCRLCFWDI